MRPPPDEYPEFFERYVSLLTQDSVVPVLNAQASAMHDALSGLSDERAGWRYAPEKWSIRELLGHVVDTERVFGCRALAIARGETHSLPSFDENAYAAIAGHDRAAIDQLAEEFATLRRSHVLMLSHLEEDAWSRKGTVNGNTMSTRAMAFIMAGHVRHHARILTERYGVVVRA